MDSSRADWVLGVARLISSARTICVMTGPGRNSNALVRWLKMETPVTSDGSRSGVNWMRRNEQPSERARALARTVLPVPGTSSTRMCPRQMSATSASSISWCLPKMTRSTFATTPETRPASALSKYRYLPLSNEDPIHEVWVRPRGHRTGAPRFIYAPGTYRVPAARQVDRRAGGTAQGVSRESRVPRGPVPDGRGRTDLSRDGEGATSERPPEPGQDPRARRPAALPSVYLLR